jgi:acetylornithine deacetylase/succinyl-diaminopimelate desuccinylase-like protein
MPSEKVEDIKATLERVLGDDQISLRPTNSGLPTPPSALDKELLSAIEKTAAEYWPGTPVVPVMFPAATDGRYTRNAGIPTYGHSGLAGDVDDERAHGEDERIAVKSFHEGGEYLYGLVKRLAGGN